MDKTTTPAEAAASGKMQTRTISQLLDAVEGDLGKLGAGSGRNRGIEILNQMDTIIRRLDEARSSGINVNAEQAQFDYLLSSIRSSADLLMREISQAEYMRERAARKPPAEYHWWYLDREIAGRKRASLKRFGAIFMIAVAIIALIVVSYQMFLAPDPKTRARYDLQYQADDQITEGNLQGALVSVNQALEYAPGDPELLIYRGGIKYKLGDEIGANADFLDAEKAIGQRDQFLTARAAFWLLSGEYELVKEDVADVLALNPKSAVALYYKGKADEILGNRQAALDAYYLASDLAEEQGQAELMASIRLNIGMLMDSVDLPTESPDPAQ